MATVTFDRELDYTLEENEAALLQAIDAALSDRRGSYGTCVSCGQPIGEERLEALPWTTHASTASAESEATSGRPEPAPRTLDVRVGSSTDALTPVSVGGALARGAGRALARPRRGRRSRRSRPTS